MLSRDSVAKPDAAYDAAHEAAYEAAYVAQAQQASVYRLSEAVYGLVDAAYVAQAQQACKLYTAPKRYLYGHTRTHYPRQVRREFVVNDRHVGWSAPLPAVAVIHLACRRPAVIHTHTHAHKRTYARTRARANTHTHTHTHARTHTLIPLRE